MPPRKDHIRAVPDGETPESAAPPAPPKRKTVTDAANDGDRRELLVALRSRIAQTVEDGSTQARDLAALSRRLLEIAREIEAIDAADRDDEIGNAAATPDDSWDSSAI